jgi:hypothetical protein
MAHHTRSISPITSFSNGKKHIAEKICINRVLADFSGYAVFHYILMTASGDPAGEAGVKIEGAEFDAWDRTSAGAYNAVTSKLGLTIISETE